MSESLPTQGGNTFQPDPIPRFAHKFQKASGSREMVQAPEGEWVRWSDVQSYLWFCGGYLDSHCAMLKGQKVHPDIIAAVKAMQKEFDRV